MSLINHSKFKEEHKVYQQQLYNIYALLATKHNMDTPITSRKNTICTLSLTFTNYDDILTSYEDRYNNINLASVIISPKLLSTYNHD